MTEARPLGRIASPRESLRKEVAQARIRHLVKGDLRALEWEGAYRRFRSMYSQAYERMRRGLAVIWLAELPQAQVIGQAFVQLKTNGARPLADGYRRAYIHSFRVRPQYRNLGLGTCLMQTAEADLIARGFKRISLNVTRENEDALRLYERLGYEVVGQDSGDWSYLDDRGILRRVHEPGWRLEKSL